MNSTTDSFFEMDMYRDWTRTTAIYPKEIGLAYAALGLAGESGEIANKVKKTYRDDNGKITDKKREELQNELGDAMYYLARVADEAGLSLQKIILDNI